MTLQTIISRECQEEYEISFAVNDLRAMGMWQGKQGDNPIIEYTFDLGLLFRKFPNLFPKKYLRPEYKSHCISKHAVLTIP